MTQEYDDRRGREGDCMSAPHTRPLVYLDYNATAPVRPEAIEAMTRTLRTVGNASSAHLHGRAAADAVEEARDHVAALLCCNAEEIIFTSGATEANNMAIRSGASAARNIVISAVEHPAVAEAAASTGFHAATVGVDSCGMLLSDDLEAALAVGPALVSIMAANNETGVLSDLTTIAKLVRDAGSVIHTDATQMVGRLPVDLADIDVDMLSLSAHKFGGPQGVGALFLRRHSPVTLRPLASGGGQEKGRRPGTLNVAGIVGTGAAAAAAAANLDQEIREVTARRDRFEQYVLAAVPDARLNGRADQRLPGVSSLTFAGAPADAVLAAMPYLSASEGSACTAGTIEPSRVLLAMGLTRDEADCTVRFSLGYATTDADIDHGITYVIDAVRKVRASLTGHPA